MSQLSLLASGKRRKPRAVFSVCGLYRWFLEWPTGIDDDRALLFIGANPSKAGSIDENGVIRSDPTISRMRNLARELGFGWAWAVNVRSFVSTDPNGVPPDPIAIGIETDTWIVNKALQAALVLCAWGHLAGERGPRVFELVRQAGKVPHALALAGDGRTPRHPRGVPKTAKPFPIPEVRA